MKCSLCENCGWVRETHPGQTVGRRPRLQLRGCRALHARGVTYLIRTGRRDCRKASKPNSIKRVGVIDTDGPLGRYIGDLQKMKSWKTPETLRLARVPQWRKNRFEKAKRDPDIAINDPDMAKLIKAANFYAAAVARRQSRAGNGFELLISRTPVPCPAGLQARANREVETGFLTARAS